MVGIIITGHGSFATGVESNVRLLAGKREEIKCIDFLAEDSPDLLEERLSLALEKLKELPQKLIFCDILSGTPFQKAVTLTHEDPGIRVIYGTNTAMVIELSMRNMAGAETGDLDELVTELIRIGKEQIGTFRTVAEEELIETDGI